MTNTGKVLLGLGVVGAATLAYVGLAKADEESGAPRNFQLVQGQRYMLSIDVEGPGYPGTDSVLALFSGFTDFSEPLIQTTYQPRGGIAASTRVTFEATWSAASMVWAVPENVQIA